MTDFVIGLKPLCSGEFFNSSQSWSATLPTFTDCFILFSLCLPSLFLLLAAIFYIPIVFLCCSEKRPFRWTRLNQLKFINGVILVFVPFMDLLKAASEETADVVHPDPIMYFSPGVMMTALIVCLLIHVTEQKRGFTSSVLLFFFYLLSLIINSVALYNKGVFMTHISEEVQDVYRLVTLCVYTAFLLLQLIFLCIYDRGVDPEYHNLRESNVCPEFRSSILSRLTFSWLDGIVIQGYKKELSESEVFQLDPVNRVRTVYNHFVRYYKPIKVNKPVNTVSTSMENPSYSDRDRLVTIDSMSYDSSATAHTTFSKLKQFPGLIISLVRGFGGEIFLAWSIALTHGLILFVQPFLLDKMISFTTDKAEAEWHGGLYTVLFLIIGLVASITFHSSLQMSLQAGMNIRSALISAVYRKSITLSQESRSRSTVGEIVNLMTVDANKIADCIPFMWVVPVAPVQIILALVMLWQQLGVGVLAGLGVFVVLLPINAVAMTKGSALETKEMSTKDERIKFLNEILNGIKVIKLYAWERSFQKYVEKIRNTEVGFLAKLSYLFAIVIVLWFVAPYIVMLVSFVTFIYSGPDHVLTAARAFVSLSLFNILRFPITVLPWMITESVNAVVSLRRIEKFLKEDDVDATAVSNLPKESNNSYAVEMVNASFSWERKAESCLLKNINCNIKSGKLVAIVGSVGSGKSTLLSSILGETVKHEGDVTVWGNIGYVPQEAWIQNLTIRENILFGSEYKEKRYNKVIKMCQLEADLDRLPAGDKTEIGERGVNLSGGQRQRVALARAVYKKADVYLLDDPLAAVDAHVGKALFNEVIGNEGMLVGSTRLLVTHGVQWLPYVDEVFVISDNIISERGTYDSLLQRDGAFAAFLKEFYIQEAEKHKDHVSTDDEVDEEIESTKAAILQRLSSVTSVSPPVKSPMTPLSPASHHSQSPFVFKQRRRRGSHSTCSTVSEDNMRGVHISRQLSSQLSTQSDKKPANVIPEMDLGRLVEEETAESGDVSLTAYTVYIKARGYLLFGLAIFAFLIYSGINIFSNVWLSIWTSDPVFSNQSIISDNSSAEYLREHTDYYMLIYTGLVSAEFVTVAIFVVMNTYTSIRASRSIHTQLLTRIMRAPMSFFETTPVGRIVNRFSKDLEVVDRELPMVINDFIECLLATLSSIIVISYTTPWFLAAVVPMSVIYAFVQRFYLPISRQSRRYDSVTRSPILTNFSETITGAAVIRAYKQQNRFIDISDARIDSNSRFYFLKLASNRWLGIRLEFLGIVAVVIASIFAVVDREVLNAGKVGLSISYALQIADTLNWMVRQMTELETDAVAVERINEYSQVVQEADWDEGSQPPADWPAKGHVAMVNYATKYREELDLALKGLSFNVEPGESVGVVGRTGAGKSSLALALFRLIEAVYGHIELDGVRIDRLGLHTLRRGLTILPQEPVVFSGLLRFNLDPFEEHDDEKLWAALEAAHLSDWAKANTEGLDFKCGEAGTNLSVGQRQLLCLARAVLRRSKVLVLDEATAAVDLETDTKVMATVRREFADSTVFIIAHRLATVMDCDRVLVLDSGRVKEFDAPRQLLQNTNSYFYKLAKDAKLVSDNGSASADLPNTSIPDSQNDTLTADNVDNNNL